MQVPFMLELGMIVYQYRWENSPGLPSVAIPVNKCTVYAVQQHDHRTSVQVTSATLNTVFQPLDECFCT